MRSIRFSSGLKCLLAVLAAMTTAHGQMTAKEVVAKSLAARGGARKFAAVRTLSFGGHLVLASGQNATLRVYTATRPSRIRIEVGLPNGTLVQGYDGNHAWQLAPGAAAGEWLSGAAAKPLADQALNFVDLIADPVPSLELLGTGSLQGREYYKLRFTLATGDAFTQYLDAHTWLAFHEEYPGGVEDISDYRAVQGLLLPFRYISGPPGKPPSTLIRDQVQINPALAPSLFTKP